VTASYADHIRQLVDQAPPLSESTRARLASLLQPVTAVKTHRPAGRPLAETAQSRKAA